MSEASKILAQMQKAAEERAKKAAAAAATAAAATGEFGRAAAARLPARPL
jgi:hypothetical protein